MEQLLKELVKLVKKKPAVSEVLFETLRGLRYQTRRGWATLVRRGMKIDGRVYHISKILDVSDEQFGPDYQADFLTDEEIIDDEINQREN